MSDGLGTRIRKAKWSWRTIVVLALAATAFELSLRYIGMISNANLKSIRQIESELVSGDGYEKWRALEKVAHLGTPEWIEKVKPQLMDEEIGWSTQKGQAVFKRRVCDIAVDVLRKIDSAHKIDFPERIREEQYTDKEIHRARMAYGLPEK